MYFLNYSEQFIKNIKRLTRRKFTAEEKTRIVLEGFRRDTPIRDLCHREVIQPSTYYAWLKDFMEAGDLQTDQGTLFAMPPKLKYRTSSVKMPV